MPAPSNFSGVYCAIVPPLERGRFDANHFQMHIQTLARDGCDGLLTQRYADAGWAEVRPFNLI
jgi:dihydrodipicolinate synthase/N-acetylneuraminate lyase